MGLSVSVVTLFVGAVLGIIKQQERYIQKYLLGFSSAYPMLVRALPAVTIVPFKAGDPLEVDHFCILQ